MTRVWAPLFVLSIAARVGAESPPAGPLLELRERAAPGATWQRVLLLGSDGAFEYLGHRGTIEEAELGIIAMDLSRATFAPPASDPCTTASYAVTTTRGTTAWCGPTPPTGVAALVAHTFETLRHEIDHAPITLEHRTYGVTLGSDVAWTIESSGWWQRGAQQGILTTAQQATLDRLMKEARFAQAADCKGEVTGAIWAWPRRAETKPDCHWDAGTERLLTFVDDATKTGATILATLERAGPKGLFRPRVVLFTDGRYAVHDSSGTLSPAELAAWKGRVAAAKLKSVSSPDGSAPCLRPPSTYRLRTNRGQVEHQACAAPLHATAAKLEADLLALRDRDARARRLVSVDVVPTRHELVFDDGTMLVEGMRRRIDPANVASLEGQVLGTTFDSKRTGDCRAPQTLHFIAAPGHGHRAWSEPCEVPDPSLQALEQRTAVLRR